MVTFALVEAQIVAGLKRSATGKPWPGAGLGHKLGAAVATGDAAALVRRSGRRLGGWAVRRSVTPNSLAGISLLFAICAAAWFSAGPSADTARGLIAAGGWLVALGLARSLAAFTLAREATGTRPENSAAGKRARRARRWRAETEARPVVRLAGARYDGTDWLVLPAVTWPDSPTRDGCAADEPAGIELANGGAADEAVGLARAGVAAADEPARLQLARAGAGGGAAAGIESFGGGAADDLLGDLESDGVGPVGATGGRGFGWVAAVSSAGAECALYGGIAAGAAIGAPGLPGAPIGMWPLAVITVSLIAVVELLAACRLAVAGAGGGEGNSRLRAFAPGPGWRPGWPLRLSVGGRALFAVPGYAIAGGRAALIAVAAAEVISIVAAVATLGTVLPRAGGAARNGTRRAVTASAAAGTRRAVTAEAAAGGGRANWIPGGAVLALRDDGGPSRWAGGLVQGTLIPLPPAFAGLIATALLAALGLHNLPGFIALTPPVVMMLAALGSSHRHDGRFDWLVPVLLASAQFVYVGALGFALAVPGPVIFSACAITFVWYAGLASSAVEGSASVPGQGAGWETRLFTVGLAATLGLATVGYVGLATYLGVFICRKATGYPMPREEDRR